MEAGLPIRATTEPKLTRVGGVLGGFHEQLQFSHSKLYQLPLGQVELGFMTILAVAPVLAPLEAIQPFQLLA